MVHPFAGEVENALGNTVRAFGADLPLAGCIVAPRPASSEPFEVGRTAVIVGMTLYGPPGALPDALDEVTLPDGHRYKVEGEPGNWGPNPYTGTRPGFEVALKRVEG
ncbi:hypothetical protein [Oerskovia jenensis]|uniref:hypothetical protein n=1 Tax=Oerskovia jenensis TaxID=162169 RepID=UPI0036DA7F69